MTQVPWSAWQLDAWGRPVPAFSSIGGHIIENEINDFCDFVDVELEIIDWAKEVTN